MQKDLDTQQTKLSTLQNEFSLAFARSKKIEADFAAAQEVIKQRNDDITELKKVYLIPRRHYATFFCSRIALLNTRA
jgi:peptidoglycan hydrolase CwlO-like protein